jgi:hypothetical protein
MKTALLALVLGFFAAIAWLVSVFFLADPRSVIQSIAFTPADFVKSHVLPYGAAAAFYGKESQWAHHSLFIWLSIFIWWIPFSFAAWLALHRLGPNNSFKPKPLRGSA